MLTLSIPVSVSSITEVRVGRNTDTFKISNSTHQEEVCFSIIYIEGKDSKNLDLVAGTEEDRKAWVEGLRALVREEGKRERRLFYKGRLECDACTSRYLRYTCRAQNKALKVYGHYVRPNLVLCGYFQILCCHCVS